MSADTCAACGHSVVFHRTAEGTGTLAAGTRYCDDRHDDPCSCSGFVEAPCPHVDLFSWALAPSAGGRYLWWCRKCGAVAVAGQVIGADLAFTSPHPEQPPVELRGD